MGEKEKRIVKKELHHKPEKLHKFLRKRPIPVVLGPETTRGNFDDITARNQMESMCAEGQSKGTRSCAFDSQRDRANALPWPPGTAAYLIGEPYVHSHDDPMS